MYKTLASKIFVTGRFKILHVIIQTNALRAKTRREKETMCTKTALAVFKYTNRRETLSKKSLDSTRIYAHRIYTRKK